MSDFDEEAERERLRERFEREEKKREATEKMSELLLKGATMTNAHCSECGDPVFRYDGQEFCATCERPVQREGAGTDTEGAGAGGDAEGANADGGEADEGEAGGEDAPANVEVTTPSDDARVKFGGDADEDESAGAEENGADAAPEPETPTPTDSDTPAATEPDAPTPGQSEATVDDEPRRPSAPSPSAQSTEDAAAAIATARADLAATLQRFARAARESESPAAATEHLEAARAAAETLDELD